jgi:hypothetical protein
VEMRDDIFGLDLLVQSFASYPEGFMWFLGAGASRSANMPTATDLIWELKLRQFCREENQDVQRHDISNRQVRDRIQTYFDSKGAPKAFANAEYSFFFEHAFGSDYSAQQQFLSDELSPTKISLNVGHRALAAMMAMRAAKVVFTTNFDNVLEVAMAEVAGKSLMAFNLEGSYAALDALNADAFPLYAKLHGDFRFRSLKNLAKDLRDNDAAIARAFLAAANRFGVVVTGYSGRDENVMRMFSEALDQANPFPAGLFWTVTRSNDITLSVTRLIAAARAKGVKAGVVEAGTFDILMNRLWRQLGNRPENLIQKVRPDHAAKVAIKLPPPGQAYPLLRTNALPIAKLPGNCGRLVCIPEMTHERLREAQGEIIPESVITLTNAVLFWGSNAEVEAFIPPTEIKTRDQFRFEDPRTAISDSTVIKGFFEHGLAKALTADRPVVLRRRGHTYYAVASTRTQDAGNLEPLAAAVAGNRRAPISGVVPKVDARWFEAVSIRLEERNRAVYLMLEPTIWITPNSRRELAVDFIRARGLKRYNPQANKILDAWIGILLGDVGKNEAKIVTAFATNDHPVSFTINTRTAYSHREQRYVS